MTEEKLKQVIRRFVNRSGSSYPIETIPGDSEPTIKGQSWHYRNKKGDFITYPNAYRRAYGKPIYHYSTMRIVVGEDWPMHMGLIAKRIKL